MEQLITVASEYGLFVALVVYVIWDSRNRENRYVEREKEFISIIDKLGDNYNNIKVDVEKIKDKLWG